MLSKKGTIRKIVQNYNFFFIYASARDFFYFFYNVRKCEKDIKKGDNFLTVITPALPLGLEPRTP